MSSGSGVALFGPPRCVLCRKREDWLCAVCREQARPPQEAIVIRGVTRALAPWAYEGGPRSLILALKLRGLKTAAGPLIEEMARCATRAAVDAEAVTWVPARARDRTLRGFDHAEVLARGVASRTGVPAVPLLARRGYQADQAGLTRSERLSNLAAAFAARSAPPRSILLIDDLVTTGATAAACTAALKGAGAGRVDLLVACRR